MINSNSDAVRIIKRCPKCGWRIFDKISPTSGVIEMKCPHCGKLITVDLSFRRLMTESYRSCRTGHCG